MIFNEEQKLLGIWWSDVDGDDDGDDAGFTINPKQYMEHQRAKSITVSMEPGQMGVVPWAKVIRPDNSIVMVNLTMCREVFVDNGSGGKMNKSDYSSPSLWLDLTVANDRIAELDAENAKLKKELEVMWVNHDGFYERLGKVETERDTLNALLDEIGELPRGDDCETCEKVICIMQKRNEGK